MAVLAKDFDYMGNLRDALAYVSENEIESFRVEGMDVHIGIKGGSSIIIGDKAEYILLHGAGERIRDFRNE